MSVPYRHKWMRHAWMRRPFIVLALPVACAIEIARRGAEVIRDAAREVRSIW